MMLLVCASLHASHGPPGLRVTWLADNYMPVIHVMSHTFVNNNHARGWVGGWLAGCLVGETQSGAVGWLHTCICAGAYTSRAPHMHTHARMQLAVHTQGPCMQAHVVGHHHTHAHRHPRIHVGGIHTYSRVRIKANIFIWGTHTNILAYMHPFNHTHSYAHIHAARHAHVHSYMHTHIYAHT